MFFVDVLAKGAIYYVQHQILHRPRFGAEGVRASY